MVTSHQDVDGVDDGERTEAQANRPEARTNCNGKPCHVRQKRKDGAHKSEDKHRVRVVSQADASEQGAYKKGRDEVGHFLSPIVGIQLNCTEVNEVYGVSYRGEVTLVWIVIGWSWRSGKLIE